MAGIDDYYCGKKNCYKLLNVDRSATLQEIKKAYRNLTKIYHPDKNQDKDTTVIFREINSAYETLSKEEIRKSYDEYLDNPNQSDSYHYYNYYKARYGPQSDPKLVITIVILVFSVFQYLIKKSMYDKALNYIENTTKFKTLLKDRVQEEQTLKNGKSREDIVKILRNEVKIEGGWSKPQISQILVIKLLLLPVNIVKGLYSSIRWTIKFRILKQEYGENEKLILTLNKLQMKKSQWEDLSEEDQEYYLSEELWIGENLKKFQAKKQEEMEEKMGSSNKYKQYKRFMKKNTR